MTSIGNSLTKKKINHRKKIAILIKNRKGNNVRDVRENFIVNKSSHVLTDLEVNVLKKGLNYQPRPERPPKNDIIASIETSIKFLPDDTKAIVRSDVSKIFEEENRFTHDSGEWKIITNLRKSDLVFLAPDKGKGVVVMDRSDYMSAALSHLQHGPYRKVTSKAKFPVDTLQTRLKKDLREMKRKCLIDEREMNDFIVDNPSIPSFSCLPKIHKEGNKMRPVVSDINSPTSKISKWLVRRMRLLENHRSFSVKNSIELTKEIDGMRIYEDEILVSFDVEALYPSVPVEEAFEKFKEWVDSQDVSDDEAELIISLMRIVLSQRWLEFDETIYEQLEGLMIGNPQSSKLAELFMGALEIAMSCERWFPRFWRRFVDDVIAIVKIEELEQLHYELNKRHPAIRFTIEKEENGSIPFLDTRLIRNNGKIEVDIFRKPTDQPLCIPFESCHDIKHRMSAFESLCFRMWNLPLNKERRKKELDYIIEMGRINGYSHEKIKTVYRKHEKLNKIKSLTTLQQQPNEKKRKTINRAGNEVIRHAVMPYYQPLTGRIKNVLKCNGINTCYKNRGTLRNVLGSVKKKKNFKEKSGIYRVFCGDCEKEYIGQTKRRLETREKEHDRAIKNKQIGINSVARHCCGTGHEKGGIELIKQVDNHWDLDSYESLFITVGENLMNEGGAPITSKLFKYASDRKRRKQ
jgi:hypothetical protein